MPKGNLKGGSDKGCALLIDRYVDRCTAINQVYFIRFRSPKLAHYTPLLPLPPTSLTLILAGPMPTDTFLGQSHFPFCPSQMLRLTSVDHKPFLSDSFDVHSYANAILQGRQYTPDQPQQNNAKEDNDKADPDVSAELARLNYGIVRFHARHIAASEQLTELLGRCDEAVTARGRLSECC